MLSGGELCKGPTEDQSWRTVMIYLLLFFSGKNFVRPHEGIEV
jgi:hypothetical protein